MATIKLKYVDRFRDAQGVWRYYFRRTRGSKRIPLPGHPGEPEFMRAYELACAATGERKLSGSTMPATGSFDALAAAYYRSTRYQTMRETTKATYSGIIERFLASTGKDGSPHGQKRVAKMESRHLEEILAEQLQSSGPSSSNNLLKVLRVMFVFALRNDWCDKNPTTRIEPIRIKSDGFATWSEHHIAKFEEHHASGTRARLALYLFLFTGQRLGDVVEMGRQHIQGDTIRVRQNKTKVSLVIPMHSKLLAEIEASAASDNLTFLLTKWSRPFTVKGLGNWFRDVCDEAGLQGLSAHGLRKAAARRLAEAGCTPHQIQAVTGHKTLAEVSRYTAAASQERMAREAMDRIGDD